MKSSSLKKKFHSAAKISQQQQKMQKKTSRIINPLFDGLAHNTGQHFTRCSHFSLPLRGSEKYICNSENIGLYYALNHRMRYCTLLYRTVPYHIVPYRAVPAMPCHAVPCCTLRTLLYSTVS